MSKEVKLRWKGLVEEVGFEKVMIFNQHLALSRKWYKAELYLQWQSTNKPYVIYRMAPFSMTLNDP